jgi:hypothetical protein
MSIFGLDSTGSDPTTGEAFNEGVSVTEIGDEVGNTALPQPQTINKNKMIVLGVGCHQASPGQDFTGRFASG